MNKKAAVPSPFLLVYARSLFSAHPVQTHSQVPRVKLLRNLVWVSSSYGAVNLNIHTILRVRKAPHAHSCLTPSEESLHVARTESEHCRTVPLCVFVPDSEEKILTIALSR